MIPPSHVTETHRRGFATTKCVEESSSNNRISNSIDPKVWSQDISPLPSTSSYKPGDKERKSRKGSAALITGTPYKDALEGSLSEQKRKKSVSKGIPKLKVDKSVPSKATNKKKGKSIAKREMAIKVSKKGVKKQESSSSSEEDEELVLDDDSDMDCDIEEEDAECIFCSGLFSEDNAGEQWNQCSKCFKWAHSEYANIDKKEAYICDLCLDG